MADLSGIVRARPKSVALTERWDANFSLGAYNVYKFEPIVGLEATINIPLDDPGCMPEAAWSDVARASAAKACRGRCGVLTLISNEREQFRAGGRGLPTISADDAIHSRDDKWTAFPIDVPVDALVGELANSTDARSGQNAVVSIETSGNRGDLRPIHTTAVLSTEVETFVFLTDVLREYPDRQLKNDIASKIAFLLRNPEAERGEYRLLLRTQVRADLIGNRKPITLQYFAIDWPYASDGSDVRLSVARSIDADNEASIRHEYEEHRFTYNAATGRAEIGNINIPWNMQSRTSEGSQVFEIILRFSNAEMQSAMAHLKAEMVLNFGGSILGIRPVVSDWSGEIIGSASPNAKLVVSQAASASIKMQINMREIFDNQYFAFGYRLRLRGVDINAERIQYVKQILSERNMLIRAEGLGRDLQVGSRVGTREWLLMADRTVQGEKLLLTTLVQCETRQVALIEGSETDRVQRQDIGADTTIDVLGALRGKREDLMNEVNAYVRDLRQQLGRFASRR